MGWVRYFAAPFFVYTPNIILQAQDFLLWWYRGDREASQVVTSTAQKYKSVQVVVWSRIRVTIRAKWQAPARQMETHSVDELTYSFPHYYSR